MSTYNDKLNMNGSYVTYRGNTIFVQIPKEAQKPIEGGCSCDYCVAHPEEVPTWNLLAIAARSMCDRRFCLALAWHGPDLAMISKAVNP